jgi:phage terminase large subunit-like protein
VNSGEITFLHGKNDELIAQLGSFNGEAGHDDLVDAFMNAVEVVPGCDFYIKKLKCVMSTW